jgi:hypothetical protein
VNKYNAIPEELRLLPQWICWRYEDIGSSKPTKVPYDCNSNRLASVNEPSTWTTFDTAVKMAKNYSGIGFVFTSNDNYSFIDLDSTNGDQIALNRQIEIHREFDSYSEISPSGMGLHIIVRGTVPAGRRRSHIEIYSSQRYATFTGNVYNNKPIADRQDKLMRLWEQMGSGPATAVFNGDEKEKYNDEEIIKQATSAANGDKFQQLFSGDWNTGYPSQSEADFALIDILAFYTQNRNQIGRIFRSSELGKRNKANRSDYLSWMINKSFDRMLPPIDFDGFHNQLELKLAITGQTPKLEARSPDHAIAIPPGLLGELAQFIYSAAPRPVPEIALAGAIGLMAGIAGRAYNISGTGLNQYILLLADTGTGKEAMASGIDKIMNSVRASAPTSSAYVGPSEIASGQALIKHINKFSQCFVSILGEFGLRLQSMSSQHASSAEVGLRRMLLDLYNKSGYGQVWRGTIYADREKNVEATRSPSFTILGESTPERFYGALNEEMISEGLLPRFLIMEYLGARPPLNKASIDIVPQFALHDKFSSFVAQCEGITFRNEVINVRCDAAAQKLLDEFDEYATNLINKSDKDIIKQLWNRAHIKALKLSALVAVGVHMIVPTILPEYVQWAIMIVRNDITALSKKFEAGLIGRNANELKQQHDLVRVVRDWITKDWDYCKKYCQGKADQKLHFNKVIPYSYLNKRLVGVAAFVNDKRSATPALKMAIQVLIDGDKIRELGNDDKAKKYNTTQRCYVITDPGVLEI